MSEEWECLNEVTLTFNDWDFFLFLENFSCTDGGFLTASESGTITNPTTTTQNLNSHPQPETPGDPIRPHQHPPSKPLSSQASESEQLKGSSDMTLKQKIIQDSSSSVRNNSVTVVVSQDFCEVYSYLLAIHMLQSPLLN